MKSGVAMKVLYLNPVANMGGAETSLVELLSAARRCYPDWNLVLVAGEDGPMVDKVRKLGIRAEILQMPRELRQAGDSGLQNGVSRWQALWRLAPLLGAVHGYGLRLREAILREKPHILHATGLKMQILAALYLPKGTRLLWHIHDYPSWRPLASKALRWLARRCDGALANSESVAGDLRSCCPGLPWVERFYNTVDSAMLNSDAFVDLDAAAQMPPAAPDEVKIGLVATYARWKGQMVFLEALAGLRTKIPWRAYIIGGPIYATAGSQFEESELRAQIKKFGLQDRVGLTGFIASRGGVMKALDIVVHASTKPEPFGMVLIEAMVSGKAVIVSQAGGAAELFEEGVTGLGHAPGDALALAARVERLLGDSQFRAELGDRGKAFAIANFSGDKLARQLETVYRRLADA